MSWLFASLHHVAAFTIAAALLTEAVLLSEPVTRTTGRRLLLVDLAFALSAGMS